MKNKALFLAIAIALTLSACSGKTITTDQNTDSEAVAVLTKCLDGKCYRRTLLQLMAQSMHQMNH